MGANIVTRGLHIFQLKLSMRGLTQETNHTPADFVARHFHICKEKSSMKDYTQGKKLSKHDKQIMQLGKPQKLQSKEEY